MYWQISLNLKKKSVRTNQTCISTSKTSFKSDTKPTQKTPIDVRCKISPHLFSPNKIETVWEANQLTAFSGSQQQRWMVGKARVELYVGCCGNDTKTTGFCYIKELSYSGSSTKPSFFFFLSNFCFFLRQISLLVEMKYAFLSDSVAEFGGLAVGREYGFLFNKIAEEENNLEMIDVLWRF